MTQGNHKECDICKKKVEGDCLRLCPPVRKICRSIMVRSCKKESRPCRIVRGRKKNCAFTWQTVGEVEVMQEVPGSCESESACEGEHQKCTMTPRSDASSVAMVMVMMTMRMTMTAMRITGAG